MTKALVAINDGTQGGVYYSANIDFTNLATQPTWTKLATTGLANTNVKVMRNDPYSPYDNIYVQLDNDDIYRWNGASWTKILDLATARTLSGLASGSVGYIAINQTVAGAVYIAIQIVTSLHLLKSTDYGANWTDTTVTNDIMTGNAYVAASGSYIDVCTGEIYRMCYMSSNNGGAYAWQGLWNNSGGGAPIRIDPLDPQYFYYRKDSSDGDLIRVAVGSITELQNGFNLASATRHEDRHWIDPLVANHHRIIRSDAQTEIFSTLDGWATLVDSTPTVISASAGGSALHCARENSDYGMYGLTGMGGGNQRVYAFVGDNPTASYPIDGTNWNTPPYTNAIPYTASSYVAVQGIYVGDAPADSGVYVYADEMGDITSLPTYTGIGIPLFGDRSSWRDMPADGYDIYHAQDVQAVTPQIHAPWDDASPPPVGYGIVSDGAKWIVSTDELALESDLHNPVTLAADADTLLGLNIQQLTLDSQSANRVFAGPTTGVAADPTFRAIVAADLGTGTADTTTYLRGDLSWQVIDIASVVISYIHEHAINEDLSGLCDGARTVFILANEYRIETTAVYLNGVRQLIVTDYTEDAGYDQITMTTAPEAGDILIIDYILADALP